MNRASKMSFSSAFYVLVLGAQLGNSARNGALILAIHPTRQ